MRRFILTITCPDRVGIVAGVTGFIAGIGGWVLEAAQHGDLESGRFFQRIEILAESLPFGPAEFAARFALLADELTLTWNLSDTDIPKRVVILASREDHCLADLLYRWKTGDLPCTIPLVLSNHTDLGPLVEAAGIPFAHIPVTAGDRQAAFDDISARFDDAGGEVMVLARYMQIVPP